MCFMKKIFLAFVYDSSTRRHQCTVAIKRYYIGIFLYYIPSQ